MSDTKNGDARGVERTRMFGYDDAQVFGDAEVPDYDRVIVDAKEPYNPNVLFAPKDSCWVMSDSLIDSERGKAAVTLLEEHGGADWNIIGLNIIARTGTVAAGILLGMNGTNL